MTATTDVPSYEVEQSQVGSTVYVTITATDQSGIHYIKYKKGLGGSYISSPVQSQHPTFNSYSYTVEVTSSTWLYYYAKDNGGNYPEYAESRWVEIVEPPSKATNPSPTNGATGQSIDTDISWSDGGGATSYDVYFGTDSTPDSGEYKGNQASTTYDPGTLNYSTTCYWRIDAKNSDGTTTGDVWHFTTESSPLPSPDTTPPDTSITDGPSGTITYNDVTFTYTGTDNVTSTSNLVYSYKLDGHDSSWSSYTSSTSKSYPDLPNGSYTFYVKAKDEAGNVDSSAAYRAFTVNYNPEAISWTPNLSSSTHEVSVSSISAEVTVSWDAMTPVGGATADSYVYVWDNTSDTDISASKTRTETYSGVVSALTVTRTLTDGNWYLHMRAVDSGSNWTNIQHFGPIIIDSTPDGLVAYYPFNGDANDSSGISEVMDLNNTEFVDNTLYLNGEYEYGGIDGYRAIANISGFDYRAFSVSLDFYSMDFNKTNILTGGTSYRWFGLRYNNGNLQLTLNNQAYVHTFTNTFLDTNNWHNVVCSFDLENKKIITMLDGEVLPDILLDSDFQLNIIGSSSEDFDKEFTFTNYSNGSVFYGYVDNLMIYNRALSKAEIQALYNYTPVISDSDSDGMLDTWEVTNFEDLSHDGTADTDSDGLTDLEEYQNSTDPNDNDTDNDGLSDGWEANYPGFDPLVDDALGDLDGDGYTNIEEYTSGTEPNDETSMPFEVREVIPHRNAGIDPDDTRVPNNTSFAVRIRAASGVNITDAASSGIRFTVDDDADVDVDPDYERDLDHATVMVTKLTEEDDTQVTDFWVVYHRSAETPPSDVYSFEHTVNIAVNVTDTEGVSIVPQSFAFKIETEVQNNTAGRTCPDTDRDPDYNDPDYTDAESVEVTSGDLEGAKIIYDSNEPVQPTFGPTDELPPCDIADADAVGVPLNLQPPTVFTTPVKIFIPCPGHIDVSSLSVYLYNGTAWVLACDADGNVQSGGDGWMAPGSRVDHPDSYPPTIEIKVYHFTGVQAALSSASGDGGNGDDDNGCFIATAAYGSSMAGHVIALKEFRDNILMKNSMGRSFMRFYYKVSPPLADYIKEHESLKAAVRIGLLPLVAVSYSTLHLGPIITAIILAVLFVLPFVLVLSYRRRARGQNEAG